MVERAIAGLLLTCALAGAAWADAEGDAMRAAAKAHAGSLVRVQATTYVSLERLPGVTRGTRRVQEVSCAGVVVSDDGLVLLPAAALDPAAATYALLGTPQQAEVGRVSVVGSDGRVRPAGFLGRHAATGLAFVRVGEAGRAGLKPVAWAEQCPPLGTVLHVLSLTPAALGHAPQVEQARVAFVAEAVAGITPQLPHAHGALVVAGGQAVGILAPLPEPPAPDVLRPDLLALARSSYLIPSASLAEAIAAPPQETPMAVGRRARAWLGIKHEVLSPELAEVRGLDVEYGIRVVSVYEGPAEVAGLAEGDVILRLDGEPLDLDPGESFDALVADYGIDETVELVVRREGSDRTLSVRLGRSPVRPADADRALLAEWGFLVRALTYFDRADLGLEPKQEGAIIVELEPDGAASRAGLRVGDLIVAVEKNALSGLEDLRSRLAKPGAYALDLRRGGEELTLRVRR